MTNVLALQVLPEEELTDRPAVETGTLSIAVWTCCAIAAHDTARVTEISGGRPSPLTDTDAVNCPRTTAYIGQW
jgi:hypothetical protein